MTKLDARLLRVNRRFYGKDHEYLLSEEDAVNEDVERELRKDRMEEKLFHTSMHHMYTRAATEREKTMESKKAHLALRKEKEMTTSKPLLAAPPGLSPTSVTATATATVNKMEEPEPAMAPRAKQGPPPGLGLGLKKEEKVELVMEGPQAEPGISLVMLPPGLGLGLARCINALL